tara:strand:+ start:1220 stop:1510 length:291 start_codon:yes stop_codon:yes gene_type:complete
MDKISRKLLHITNEVGTINTQIQNLVDITYSNTRSIMNIREKIENLLGRIQNVKAHIERSKKSSISQFSNNDDLKRHIISFLDSLDIELTDILENI